MMRGCFLVVAIAVNGVQVASAQGLSATKQTGPVQTEPRMGITAALGVCYVSATDLVDRVNGTMITTERVSGFTAGGEFYGAFSVPASKDWILKLEYAYLIASYNVPTISPGSQFSFWLHMPTLVGQYVLIDRGIYNVKGGVGLGYHFGSYQERYGTLDATFTGSGPAIKLDFEANTAFGEDFYMYIGADFRFDFVGTLTSENTQIAPGGIVPTLNFFSAGAKLGFTFYL